MSLEVCNHFPFTLIDFFLEVALCANMCCFLYLMILAKRVCVLSEVQAYICIISIR